MPVDTIYNRDYCLTECPILHSDNAFRLDCAGEIYIVCHPYFVPECKHIKQSDVKSLNKQVARQQQQIDRLYGLLVLRQVEKKQERQEEAKVSWKPSDGLAARDKV